MRFPFLRPGLVLAALGLLAPGPMAPTVAHAQVIPFGDRASFTAATVSLTTIDFNGLAGGSANSLPNPSVISGVTFSTNGDVIFAVNEALSPDYDYNSGDVLSPQSSGTSNVSLTAVLPAGTTAVGLDFGNVQEGGSTNPIPFTITLSTGDTFTINGGVANGVGGPGFVFAGFTSTVSITSLTIGGNVFTPAYDNFAYGAAAPAQAAVPEPGTLALLLVGGLTTGAGAPRRRRT